MMRTSSLAIFAAIALSVLAAPAQAQPQPQPGIPQGPDLLKIAQAVGLSAAQIAQIKKIGHATQREAIPLQAKLRLAQLELQEAIEGDNPPSEKQVSALVDRIGGHETQLKKGHVLMMLRVRRVMSKPQWDKLQVLHAERHGMPRGPHAPPSPPGPPGPPPPPRHP
jgi:Spy/CpxP family protein refolding chaperone